LKKKKIKELNSLLKAFNHKYVYKIGSGPEAKYIYHAVSKEDEKAQKDYLDYFKKLKDQQKQIVKEIEEVNPVNTDRYKDYTPNELRHKIKELSDMVSEDLHVQVDIDALKKLLKEKEEQITKSPIKALNDLLKAFNHKYLRREGSSGNYKYYYDKPQIKNPKPEEFLYHYSHLDNLTQIDPEKQGTGTPGLERDRTDRVPRSYYYTSPDVKTHEAVVKDRAVKMYKIKKPSNIFNLGDINPTSVEHLAELRTKWKIPFEGVSDMERQIKENGYAGFMSPTYPDVVVLFDKQDIVEDKPEVSRKRFTIKTSEINFDVKDLDMRRFWYSPKYDEWIFGIAADNDDSDSHADEFTKTEHSGEFDDYTRGFIGNSPAFETRLGEQVGTGGNVYFETYSDDKSMQMALDAIWYLDKKGAIHKDTILYPYSFRNYFKDKEIQITKSLIEVLRKGKPLPPGTIRKWGGVDYRKEASGEWLPVKDQKPEPKEKPKAKKEKKEDPDYSKTEHFEDIVRNAEFNIDEVYTKISELKVSPQVAQNFKDKYGANGETPREALQNFIDEVKANDTKKERAENYSSTTKINRETFENTLDSGKFGFISAGKNPNDPTDAKMDDKAVNERYDKLRIELDDLGIEYVEVEGKYGESEASFMIMNADRKALQDLGKKYNQDSIIYGENGNNEMIYTTGENAGKMQTGKGWEEKPEADDFYSVIEFANGEQLKFALNFDFDNLLDSDEGAKKPSKIKALSDKLKDSSKKKVKSSPVKELNDKLKNTNAKFKEQADKTLEEQVKKLDPQWSTQRNEKGKLELKHNDGRIVKVPEKANYEDLPNLLKESKPSIKLAEGTKPEHFQMEGDFSNVRNWKAKILSGNSMTKDKKLGQMDNVGYIAIPLKDDGGIIPIARADEHQAGYEILRTKYKKNPQDYITIYGLGTNYIGATDQKEEKANYVKAYQKYLDMGGKDGVVQISGEGKGDIKITMSDYIKNEGKIKFSKEYGQEKTLAPIGSRIIDNWTKIHEVFDKKAKGQEITNSEYKKVQKTTNQLIELAESWEGMDLLKDDGFLKIEDLIKKLKTANDSLDLDELEPYLLGVAGLKNKMHNALREASKDNSYYTLNKIYGSAENALEEFNKLTQFGVKK